MITKYGSGQILAIALLLFLLLPALYLMVKQPIYNSYDALTHIARISEYHKATLAGQFPPRIAPTITGSIGYPLFIVNYQLPYFFAEIFMFFFNNQLLAFKAVMSITYIFGGIFAYMLFRKIGTVISSLTGALIFSYLPYRFADLYYRGSLGECVSVMFIPLVLLSLHYSRSKNARSIMFIALAVFGIVTSHTVIFAIFAPFFALYTIVMIRPDKKTLLIIMCGVALGIIASSFQLLPSIFEKNYLKFDDSLLTLYRGQFVKFPQLYRLPGFGINLGTSIQAGIVSALVIFAGLGAYVFKRDYKLLLFLTVSLAASFLIIGQSQWLWDHITLLKVIIFPWRFISLIIMCVSFLVVLELDLVKIKWAKFALSFLLVSLTFYTSRHYFLNSGVGEQIYPPESLSHFAENDPVWSSKETYLEKPLFTAPPTVTLQSAVINPYHLKFTVNSTEASAQLVIRKLYFPGWRAIVDKQKGKIYPSGGLISLKLPSGTSFVDLSYQQTTLETFANFISLFTLALILFLPITGQRFLKWTL